MRTLIKKTSFVLVMGLIIFSPFHAFLSTVLLHKFGLADMANAALAIKAWKELIIATLLALATYSFVFHREKFNRVHWVTIFFVVVGVAVTLVGFEHDLLAQYIWGARAEFSLFALLFALMILVRNWSQRKINIALKTVFWVAVVVLLTGVLLQLVGYESLINFGYRDDWSTYYLDQAPAFCQQEAGTDFCRAQSTFPGPTRYGAYLIVIIPFLYAFNKGWKRWAILALASINLILTLSLGSWLAVIFIGLVALGFRHESFVRQNWKEITFGAIVLLMLGLIALSFVFSHYDLKASDLEHIQYPLETLKMVADKPFGHGLGFFGPASFKVEQLKTVDNWYLAVAGNVGIVGLIFFIWIWYEIVMALLRKGPGIARVAVYASAAVLVQILFLDTLVESGMFVALTVFIALGIEKNFMLSSPRKNKKEHA